MTKGKEEKEEIPGGGSGGKQIVQFVILKKRQKREPARSWITQYLVTDFLHENGTFSPYFKYKLMASEKVKEKRQ